MCYAREAKAFAGLMSRVSAIAEVAEVQKKARQKV